MLERVIVRLELIESDAWFLDGVDGVNEWTSSFSCLVSTTRSHLLYEPQRYAMRWMEYESDYSFLPRYANRNK